MIEFLQYSSLANWGLTMPASNSAVEMMPHDYIPLSELLERVLEPVVIQDNVEYKRLTVKTGGAGAIVRMRSGKEERILGKDIGRKNQFRVHCGQMVVSSIDARNGAAGIVPTEADGCVVTDNFWVFDVRTDKVVPFFLQLLLARPSVMAQIETISHGSTNRQYITIDQFLNLTIALPDMLMQKKIIAQYRRQQTKMAKLEDELYSFGEQRETLVSTVLGYHGQHEENNSQCLFVIEFRNLYKWSSCNAANSLSFVRAARMKECIGEFMTNDDLSLRVEPQKTPGKNYRYIGMNGVEKKTGLLVDKPKLVKGKDIKSASVMVPMGYVIYGKLRPYLNKFWKNDTYKADVICSSEFLVFRPSDRLDIGYFMAILGSDYLQRQIAGKLAGTRMPRLSTTDFLDLELPEPDMTIQKKLGDEIKTLQVEVERKRKQLKRLSEVQREKLVTSYDL